MKVRCAYTSCKNNEQKGNGYFCILKEISIEFASVNGGEFKMQCYQYKKKKGYAY